MAKIHVLDSDTINRIAAGEVVERPVNVVKELVENAIDAGASAITVEIKNGGIDLIRVTDNGSGIEADEVTTAFRRHATSKISSDRDLSNLETLGFRGEALSSIAAVSQVEMITKTRESLVATRARNNAVAAAASLQTTDIIPLEITEVGAPDGTTVIVRDIFYNVPVRKKFLKSPQTEGGYITDLVEHLALSHPEISFHYRVNSTEKLHTTGNGKERELIYRIYGREMAGTVIPINVSTDSCLLEGYLGRPEFSRSSRNFEIFFVNGRILRSDVLSKALEEGYGTDLMQHRFPFAILHLTVPAEEIDVNVHPAKMEVRFSDARGVYDFIADGVHRTLHGVDLIPKSTFLTEKEKQKEDQKEAKEREEKTRNGPSAEQFEQNARIKEGDPVPEAAPGEKRSRGYAPAEENGYLKNNAAGTSFKDAGEKSGSSFKKQLDVLNEVLGSAGAGGSAQDKDAAAERKDGESAAPCDAAASAAGLLTGERITETLQGDEKERSGGSSLKGSDAGTKDGDDFFFEDTRSGKKIFEQLSLFESEGKGSDKTKAPEKSGDEEPGPDHSEGAGQDQSSEKAQAKDTAFGESLREFTKEKFKDYRIIGQVFKTYWVVEYKDKMLVIDQHAAHEKVNFERLMKRLEKENENACPSQLLSPPIVVNLTGKEEGAFLQYRDTFEKMGYEIEDFGEGAFAIRAVPLELYANEPDALFREVLDEILEEKMGGTPAAILYKIASMSCKAAVKGNTVLSFREAQALIDELLSLDNPYHCPHGRPTMIILTKQEMEKKFKRIV